MILTSRSRIVAYNNCERLGYLTYDWNGTGISPVSTALPLAAGISVHEIVARILHKEPIDEVIADEIGKFQKALLAKGVQNEDPKYLAFLAKEQSTMLEGTIRAWLRVRYPRLLAEYDLIAIEKELNWPIAEDIIDQVRCDLLARRKSDGALFYIEWKTTSGGGDEWAKQWEHNTQLLANTLAIEEMLGERMDGVIIEGLVKGRRKPDENPRSPFFGIRIQQSPLCYGYQDTHTKDLQVKYTSAKGWQRVASWEVCSNVTEWMDRAMTQEDLVKLFAPLPPIRPRKEHLDRWREQTIALERRRKNSLDDLRKGAITIDQAFPMNDEHCFRYWGHPCAYEKLCFGSAIANDPIGSGMYEARVSHHGAPPSEEV